MAVKIRLARAGAKKAPFYRVVAADSRSPRDGRFIEILGRYNPRTEPSSVELDLEKVDAWIAKGAQPTEAAAKLIAIARGEKKPRGRGAVKKRQQGVREGRPSETAAAKASRRAESASPRPRAEAPAAPEAEAPAEPAAEEAAPETDAEPTTPEGE